MNEMPCLNPEQENNEAEFQLIKRSIEALLFVASEPLTTEQLADLVSVSKSKTESVLLGLEEEYHDKGFRLRKIAGGWQFITASEFSHLIEKMYRPKFQQLSNAAMETLAIIAYKQPITRAEISEIRGVDSDGVVGTLLDKHLICETGRVAGAGHAILYGTSSQFLEFFGLNQVSDLPALKSFEEGENLTI